MGTRGGDYILCLKRLSGWGTISHSGLARQDSIGRLPCGKTIQDVRCSDPGSLVDGNPRRKFVGLAEWSVRHRRESFLFPDRENLWSFLRLREAVCNAAFLQMLWCKQYGSNLSLWSISNEGLYYLAWFGLVLGVRQRIFLTIPTVVALIVVCSLARTQVSEYTAVSYLVYFLVWMSGALLFCLDKPSLRLLALASALSACLWLYLRRQGLWLASDLMLGCAFVCVLKVLEVRDVAYFADFGFARATSEISFSLYATHVPVAVFVLSLLGQIHPVSASWRSLASFLLITTSCLAVSTAFWWAFESRTHSVRTIIRNTISGLYVKPASKNR